MAKIHHYEFWVFPAFFIRGEGGGGFLILLGTSEPNFSFLVTFSVLEANSSLPHNELLSKDSAVVSSQLFSTDSLLEGQIYKAGTHIKFSDYIHKFAKFIPEVSQK